MLDGLVYLTFLLLFRWGPGPHEVLFTILFQGQELEFVIEMAPLDAVPHAVHVFLEQVAHGLWNRTYIYLNGPHVVQIGPQLIDDDDEDDDEHDHHHDHHPEHHHDDDDEEEESEDLNPATRAFRELGLDKLAFSDYSADFPHVPWTLGYTGRPGGPDFYINKVDNQFSHGAGGQTQHALEEQGDACFAKITRGLEHIHRISREGTIYHDDTEWHYFLVDPVEILRAVVLTTNPNNQ